MKTLKCLWSTVIFQVLLVTAIQMHARAYKVLMMPLPRKSHVISMAAMSESLVNKGHRVVFFVGENCPLNLPELRNRSEFSVMRYRDATNGGYVDYEALADDFAKSVLESGGDMYQMLSSTRKTYLNLFFIIICPE